MFPKSQNNAQQQSLLKGKKKFGSSRRSIMKTLGADDPSDTSATEYLLENEKRAPKAKINTMEALELQVGEVQKEVRITLKKLEDKGEKIEDLEKITGDLEESSKTFQGTTDKLLEGPKREQRKRRVASVLCILVLLMVIPAAVYLVFIHS